MIRSERHAAAGSRPGRIPPRTGTSAAAIGTLVAVFLVALTLRVWPWFRANTFLGVQEYDDGVYYGASRLLLHGLLPYRDVTIVHPPGISVLLLPFAGVGSVLGDPVGLAAARVVLVLVALGNVLLVYRISELICRGLPDPRRARWSSVAAAGLYAVAPGAVTAEHTVLLEPWCNLFALLAVWVLLREPATRRAAFWAGALLVLALSVKLFAATYVLAIAAWLLVPTRRHRLAPLAGGALLGFVLIFLPFIAAAPGAFVHDVVVTQLSRPGDSTAQGLTRLLDMWGLRGVPAVVGAGLLLIVLVTVCTRAVKERSTPYALVALTMALTTGAFLTSATYFPHYGGFLAPVVALLGGQLVAHRSASPSRSGLRTVGVVALLVTFSLGAIQGDRALVGQPDFRRAGALVPAGACVYVQAQSAAIAAGLFALPSGACPSWVDGRGVLYTQSTSWPRGKKFYNDGFTENSSWQAATVDQLRHASFLLIQHPPGEVAEWSASTQQYATSHFALLLALHGSGRGAIELWKRSADD